MSWNLAISLATRDIAMYLGALGNKTHSPGGFDKARAILVLEGVQYLWFDEPSHSLAANMRITRF